MVWIRSSSRFLFPWSFDIDLTVQDAGQPIFGHALLSLRVQSTVCWVGSFVFEKRVHRVCCRWLYYLENFFIRVVWVRLLMLCIRFKFSESGLGMNRQVERGRLSNRFLVHVERWMRSQEVHLVVNRWWRRTKFVYAYRLVLRKRGYRHEIESNRQLRHHNEDAKTVEYMITIRSLIIRFRVGTCSGVYRYDVLVPNTPGCTNRCV